MGSRFLHSLIVQIFAEMKKGPQRRVLDHLQRLHEFGLKQHHEKQPEGVDVNLSRGERWWLEILKRGKLGDSGGWDRLVFTDYIVDFYEELFSLEDLSRRSTETELGILLKTVCPPIIKKRIRYEGKQKYVYLIPSLIDCRAIWEDRFGPQQWEDINE